MPAVSTNPPSKASKSSTYWQQTMQNRMLVIVLAMVVAVPLLALPSNQNMQNIANYALRLMAALLAGILVMRARVATKSSEVMTFLATGANLAVVLFVLDTVLSLIIAPRDIRISSSVDFMRVVTGVLLYFALAYHVRRSEHLVKIQDAMVLVSVIISSLGLINVAVAATGTQANVVQTSLFGDHQLYGAMMMMLFPITLVAAVTEKNPKRHLIAQGAAIVTFICLILSQTRTSWFGAIAELIALLLFSRIVPKRNNQKQNPSAERRQYIIPVLIVLTCGVLFALLGGADSAIRSRILDAQNSRDALDYRSRMWYAAEEMVKSSPVLGHGLGSYARDQSSYSSFGREGDKITQGKLPSLGEMAHNFWLQTAAEQGILGAAIFAAIILTFLANGMKRLRYLDGGIRRWLLLASMAAVIGFAVDGLGNPAWQFAQIAMFFWLMLGLGVAGMRPRNPREGKSSGAEAPG